MRSLRQSLLCAGLIVSTMPALSAADTPATPTLNETETARVYAEKARAAAQGQSDHDLLLALSARLFQLEDRLATVAKQSGNDTRNLREGVQAALNQVGMEIGRINGELRKLVEKSPAPSAVEPAAKP